jgi:hypothetical protein
MSQLFNIIRQHNRQKKHNEGEKQRQLQLEAAHHGRHEQHEDEQQELSDILNMPFQPLMNVNYYEMGIHAAASMGYFEIVKVR